MPAHVFVDPRPGRLTSLHDAVEAVMRHCGGSHCPYSDGRAVVDNAVAWRDLWGSRRVPIRLGSRPTPASPDPPPPTGAVTPGEWTPLQGPEPVTIDQDGTLVEGLLCRVVEDLECGRLSGARIVVIEIDSQDHTGQKHHAIGLDVDLFDRGRWKSPAGRAVYEAMILDLLGRRGRVPDRVETAGQPHDSGALDRRRLAALRAALDDEPAGGAAAAPREPDARP